MRHGELLAHVNGDRFVMFMHSESNEALEERLGKLRDEIRKISSLLDVPQIAPVFGVKVVNNPSRPERSYGDANLAKQSMGRRLDMFCAFFDDKLQEKILEGQHFESRFEHAMRTHEFEVWYQPKYDPQTNNLHGAEALVRWRIGEQIVPPGKFIPLFERNGIITRLDAHIFELVCAQMRAWMDAKLEVKPVSINVSRVSLHYEGIVGRYVAIANKYRIPTHLLELEITESSMGAESGIDETIRQLRMCGFRVLLDDFGIGFSSLSTITKDYFDCIKIDKSLVDCINTEEGRHLLESTIHLAHKLNLTVVAEGVEEAAQVEILKKLSCDIIQGFYYSKAQPATSFKELLSA